MLKRWSVIVGAAIVALVGFLAYFAFSFFDTEPVRGVADQNETIAWLTLGTAVVSMLTAFAGLAQRLLEIRKG
jgi:hypothetical protein